MAFLVAAFAAGGTVASAGVSFSTPPAAVKAGDKTRISFTLSEPSDVEVAVLSSANGGQPEVVRRLAAGVLGGANPPPAPLQAGLAQALEWDGKDDFGKPAGGPFTVRVRAGTGVKFGRFLGEAPYTFGTVKSLAADETGNLYVLGYGGNRNQNFRCIRVFDSDGNYLREAMPFPADLPPDGMKDVAVWDEEAATFYPQNLSSLNPEFYVLGGWSIVSVSTRGGIVLTDGGSVFKLDTRGAVAAERFSLGALWAKNAHNPNTGGGPVFLAASPDGQTYYLAGPYSAKTPYGHTYIDKFPPGRVYRMQPGGNMEPFATIPVAHADGQGGAWRKANAYQNDGVPEGPLHGLTVDGKGNVFVCDWENQRVAVFGPDARALGEIKAPCPHMVAVSPATGAIYVLSRHCAGYWKYKVSVSKFADYAPGATAVATYAFPDQSGGWPQMAVVTKGKDATVFVAGVTGGLAALADKGTEFELVKTKYAPEAEVLDVFNRMEVDSARDEVYVSDGGNMFWRFDGKTGQGQLLKKDGKPFMATDLGVGYNGLLYFQTGSGFSGPLERLTRELEPAPYESGTHVLSKYIYGRYGIGNCEKGIGVGPDGSVYVAWMFGGWVKYAVSGWGPDGKPINGTRTDIDPGHYKAGTPEEMKKSVIGPIPQCNGGVRVDLSGNIYVGMIAGKVPVPKAFESNAGYKHCTGAVVKFGPEGGAVTGDLAMLTGGSIEGALAVYPGLSPFSHPHLATTCCVCRVPRFGVDRYGRLVLPNATGNYVVLLDNAGNEILHFGKYGNFDSLYVNPNTEAGRQGKPAVAVPDIPLAWPNSADASDSHVYVLDVYSHRVRRTDLTWQLEKTCAVK
jgi:DNA-binding beta-propeller fold protein YncE